MKSAHEFNLSSKRPRLAARRLLSNDRAMPAMTGTARTPSALKGLTAGVDHDGRNGAGSCGLGEMPFNTLPSFRGRAAEPGIQAE
jgi:hypothetical protein